MVPSTDGLSSRNHYDSDGSTVTELRETAKGRENSERARLDRLQAPTSASEKTASHKTAAGEKPRKAGKAAVTATIDLCYAQIRPILLFIVVLGLARFAPGVSPYVKPFSQVQYPLDGGRFARNGLLDVCFVLTCTVLIIGARAITMIVSTKYIAPWLGIHHSHGTVRFAEQAWNLLYSLFSWSLGLYLLHISSYGWNPEQMWQGFPHYELDPGVKAFYLMVMAFWVSQIYVLNVEERRKDHYQMFTHHIVTILLVAGSYMNYYTRIGHIIMVLMDVVDALLSFAKLLKYLGFEKACDYAFVLFLVGWVGLRHVVYLYQMWYAYFEAPKAISGNCTFDEAGNPICYNQLAHSMFGFLLLILQLLTIMWLYMIIRVLVKILRGGNAEDSRSDGEDSDSD